MCATGTQVVDMYRYWRSPKSHFLIPAPPTPTHVLQTDGLCMAQRTPQAIFTDDLVQPLGIVARTSMHAQLLACPTRRGARCFALDVVTYWPCALSLCLTLAGTEDIGIVERAPNSSDEESEPDDDDINDDIEDERDGRRLPPGSAKVRWSKRDNVLTEYTENLRLIDRVFLLGDIVARAADQLGQTGIVVGMRMFCDVKRSRW